MNAISGPIFASSMISTGLATTLTAVEDAPHVGWGLGGFGAGLAATTAKQAFAGASPIHAALAGAGVGAALGAVIGAALRE